MSLHALFAPKSIAVIGASTKPGSVGNDIARNLVESDFAGEIYLVNPKTETLFDRPCFPTIGAIGKPVELAIVVVPAAIVPTVLREAGAAMVRAAVIISSGFKETGPTGAALEEAIRGIAQEHAMALLGPNCLGFIVPRLFLNASFASSIPQAGTIAFFSQSGALLSALLDHARERLGFSAFVSIGNKAMIDEPLLLKHFSQDAETHVLGLYTENLSDAAGLIATGRSLLRGKNPKPLVALKSGKTEAGTHASSSHTGAVAGSAAAYATLFRQARILEASTFNELLDLLEVLSHNPLPRGKRLAILTNAGGFGVLATDAAMRRGLTLASLTPETEENLRAVLPPSASVANPVDILGDARADRYAAALNLLAADPNIDLLLVLLTPQTMTEPQKTAEAIAALRRAHPALPLVAVFAGTKLVQPGIECLRKAHVPVLGFPEAGAETLAALATIAEWKNLPDSPFLDRPSEIAKDKARALVATYRARGLTQLNEFDTSALLSLYGLPFLKSALATSAEAGVVIAGKIGRPVALKIVSPDIIHKSDVGGVALNVAPEKAGEAFDSMIATIKEHLPQAKIDGALVVEMAQSGGRELLLGLKKEPGLGTLLVFGLGGIYVETFEDIALRFLPLTEADLDALMDEIKTAPLLAGIRGQAGIDRERLKDCLRRLAAFAEDFPEVAALDINPLLAFPDASDFRILDARITLE